MGGTGQNADRGRAGVPPTARTRSVVSFSAKSAATMEDGGRHFSGSLSRRDDPEPDARCGDSALEFHPRQRRLQRLCGGSFDLGGDASDHTRSSWLVVFQRKQDLIMNSQASPELILHNGRITTLDPAHPEATNLAVKDGRIVGVDDAEEYERGLNIKVIDLKGRRVIPGLNDSHLHVIRGGLNYNMELRWDGVPSLADALHMLKQQAQRTPPGQWVRVVGGWSEFQFAERRMPTLAEINAAAPETPVFILHLYDRAILNAAALRVVGYTKEPPNPPGGEIQRDSKGNPTGLLIARPNATILYASLAKGPKLPPEQQMNSTRHFMRELNRLGLTR